MEKEDGVARRNVDRLRRERHPGVWHSGDWKATALEAEVWVDTVTEKGKRFVAA